MGMPIAMKKTITATSKTTFVSVFNQTTNHPPAIMKKGKVVTETNNAGGILGGISNGMPIIVRVAVKPTPSIYKSQATVDLNTMKKVDIKIHGRHDTCIVPRAVPIVESMIAITLCDLALRAQLLPRMINK